MELEPYATAEMALDYVPSALGQLQDGMVTISSLDAGTWEYGISCRGVPPTVMDTTPLNCVLGSAQQSKIVWRNPFPEPVVANVQLVGADAGGAIELLMGKNDRERSVPAFSTVQVCGHEAME